jgi:hypothetical protein
MNSIIYIILGIIILYAIYILFFQIDRYHGGGIGPGGMPPRSAIRASWGGYGYPGGWGGWGGCGGIYPRKCPNCIGDYEAVSQEQNATPPAGP